MRLDDPVAGLCIFFLLESILSRRPAAVLFILSTFPWVDAHMAGMAGKVLLPEEAAGPGQHRRRGRVGSSAWRALRRIDFFPRRNGWHVGVPCLFSLCSGLDPSTAQMAYEHTDTTAWLRMRFPANPEAPNATTFGGDAETSTCGKMLPSVPFTFPRYSQTWIEAVKLMLGRDRGQPARTIPRTEAGVSRVSTNAALPKKPVKRRPCFMVSLFRSAYFSLLHVWLTQRVARRGMHS